MIKELEIENFKSVKHLKLPCRRINIFIGEPNTGKSNILEALGVLSFIYYGEGRNLKDFVRMERLPDLFHNEDIEKPIRIKADEKIFEMKMEQGSFHCVLNGRRHASFYSDGHPDFCLSPSEMPPFKFYRFAVKERFPKKEMEELLPPFGENLSMLLLTRREIRNRISPIIENFGLKLMFRKLEEDKIELLRSLEEGVFISLPYFLLSDTLQRFIFHFAAVLSNKDSVIAFEEPEAHAFPYYTKFLAESIALDDRGNQYFISTHNPLFLMRILEKAPEEEVNVFITYLENFETKVRLLAKEQKEEILDLGESIFFNLEKLLPEESGRSGGDLGGRR